MALSNSEVGYIVITEDCNEMLWMNRFFKELSVKQKYYVVYIDRQSATHLSENSSFYSKSKHINVKCHWMQDVLNLKLLKL